MNELPTLITGTTLYGVDILADPILFRDWFDMSLKFKDE